MRWRMQTFSVLASLALAGCASPARPAPAPWNRAQAEREVVATAVREAAGVGAPTTYVVNPVASEATAEGLERLGSLRADTRADYLAQPQGHRLPQDLDPGAPVRWFTDADWQALPEAPGFLGSSEGRWTVFRQRFPGAPGLTECSVVGFSHDGRQAVLRVAHHSASLSGSGTLLLLERGAQGWRVVARAGLWIA